MSHEWTTQTRFFVDGYPLLLLERGVERMVLSEGRYAAIIQFFLPLADPSDQPEGWQPMGNNTKIKNLHNPMHRAFVAGQSWTDGQGQISFCLLDPVRDLGEYQTDPEFLELAKTTTSQIWHVNVAWWRNEARYIPKNSLERILEFARLLLSQDFSDATVISAIPQKEFSVWVGGCVICAGLSGTTKNLFSNSQDTVQSGALPLIAFLLEQVQNETGFAEFWDYVKHGQGFKNIEPYPKFFKIPPEEVGDFQRFPEFRDFLEQCGTLPESVWLYLPTWDSEIFFMHDSSIQKITQVARALHLSRELLIRANIQVLSLDDWDAHFGWAASTGLYPSQLPPLEQIATRYLQALKTQSADLEPARKDLLEGLHTLGLLNTDIADGVYSQLQEQGHLNLKTCVDNAEYLYTYMKRHTDLSDIRKLPISLDWMIHAPQPVLSEFFVFLQAAEHAWYAANPQSLVPLEFKFLTVPIRLFLVWDNGASKLANAKIRSEP
jgi:hypothetical protein